MKNYGSIVLYEAIPLKIVHRLAASASLLYAIVAPLRPLSFADHRVVQTYKEWGGIQLEDGFEILRERSLHEAADHLKIVVNDLLSASGDSETKILPALSFFRELTPDNPVGVEWHCDAEAASTMLINNYEEIITMWVPLVPVGNIVPSLEIAIGSGDKVRSEPLTPRLHRQSPPEGCEIRSPVLDPGDAIAFDQHTVHRTQQIPVRDLRRTCELRFRML